jgi:DNA-binding CsgD family transcriptional regulator
VSTIASTVRGSRVPRTVGAAAETALAARGDARRLGLALEQSPVPMVLVDAERRYVEANRPARLSFRLSLEELRSLALDDLTPPEWLDDLERTWTQLMDIGCVAGPFHVAGLDDSRFDIVYCALANMLPGLHLIVFAPAEWPEDELGPIDVVAEAPALSLTRREIEVLTLAAEGGSQTDLGEQLALSPATVKTHLSNIYAKLDVSTRTGAVARAMRLGVIE